MEMEEYYEISRIDKGIQYIHEKKGCREKEKPYAALAPQINLYTRSYDIMEQFILKWLEKNHLFSTKSYFKNFIEYLHQL